MRDHPAAGTIHDENHKVSQQVLAELGASRMTRTAGR